MNPLTFLPGLILAALLFLGVLRVLWWSTHQ